MLAGDFVAKVTKKIGVKQCIPCQGRQTQMNQMHENFKAKIQALINKGRGSSDSSQ